LINDIEKPKTDDPYDLDGKYVLTDGVGNISLALCEIINEKFKLIRCSAYQVRLGGAKGVLICKPSLGNEEEKIVELRKS
jgi:hypothetical protein